MACVTSPFTQEELEMLGRSAGQARHTVRPFPSPQSTKQLTLAGGCKDISIFPLFGYVFSITPRSLPLLTLHMYHATEDMLFVFPSLPTSFIFLLSCCYLPYVAFPIAKVLGQEPSLDCRR